VIGRIGAILAILATVPTLARLVEPVSPSPAPQLAAFAPWVLPVWVVAGALLVFDGPRWLAAAVVVAIALHAWWLIPPANARAAASQASTGGVPMRLMTLNVEFGRADAVQTLELVRRHEVDVLVVEELTPGFVSRLRAAGVDAVLGYSDLHPHYTAAGTGIWSRWPLRPIGLLPSMGFTMPRAAITVPALKAGLKSGTASGSQTGASVGGRGVGLSSGEVTVTGVHTIAPMPYRVGLWRSDLRTLATTVASSSGPQIFAGDFNASRDHGGFRDILAKGVVDAGDAVAVAPWPGFTWPADGPGPPATRLDHVLITPDSLAVRRVQVVTVPGTDHRAVIVELSVSD
jgi:endonuclease/exonuclease/phosphatase (EEP) superfamily protein YafD